MTRIVIDIPDPNALHYVLDVLRQPRHSWTNDIAAQIEAQYPPRIEEPGLWGVVRAGSKYGVGGSRVYMHRDDNVWVCSSGTTSWDDLIDPVLIRAGIS
jgi:hypothetical protein